MAFNYLRIPIDYKEWYYIVATYNPQIAEDDSFNKTWSGLVPGTEETVDINFNENKLFWQNHLTLGNFPTANSGNGARCKVEMISKTDLMRVRGFKEIN